MKTIKYLNIQIKGEKNIGVIQYIEETKTNKQLSVKSAKNPVTDIKIDTRNIEAKMVQALREHFDCPVKTISINIKEVHSPCLIEVNVIIESDANDYQEKVILEQTWVY